MTDQLNLGELELGEICDWDEHEVHVPMNLTIDDAVPGEAKAVYLIMKSVGKRAEASLETYARKLVWTPDTVKKWQKILVTEGWMVLAREGKGTTPRLWWMAKYKGEKPPLGVLINAPLQKSRPLEKATPKQGASSKQSVSNTHTADAVNVKHPDQDKFWVKANEIWLGKHPGKPLEWPGPRSAVPIANFHKKLTACLNRWGWEQLTVMWGNCVNDRFVMASLRVFFADPEKYSGARQDKGGAYHQVEVGSDFKG